MSISHELFGTTTAGAPVARYRLTNDTGMTADILTYGATLAALRVPDRQGQCADVVLGFDTLAPYLDWHPYFGAVVGRYANRIAGGRFSIDGQTYQLPCNSGPNHLHGGDAGFHRQVWAAEAADSPAGPSVELRYRSPAAEESYPGSLIVTLRYTLEHSGALRLDYSATTDQPTLINLTSHGYFNLAGAADINGHELELYASHYLPVDEHLIPTGELRPVAGTPLDFSSPQRIGARAADASPGGGYDHCWVLDKPTGALALAARLYDPGSGRLLEMYTTEPGLQVFSSHGFRTDMGMVGHGGQIYGPSAGLCLEAQHFPDSPNQPAFPSTILRPGELYTQTTIYRFAVRG